MQRRPSRGAEAKGRAKVASGAAAAPQAADRKRYGATVEKGPAVWKQEWSHFMSNVRRKDEGATVDLRSSDDFGEGGQGATFSYLFHSNTAVKEAGKQRAAESRRPKRDREEEEVSKMQQLTDSAKARGVKLEGMNRKERRAALNATVTEETIAAEKEAARAEAEKANAERAADDAARETRPHELMDPKLEWYQQGPPPLDQVSERLVAKKAVKHARQQGLRYNYLMPHPSWIAARAVKRRDLTAMVGIGSRVVFGKDDGGVQSSVVLPFEEPKADPWAAARQDAAAALAHEEEMRETFKAQAEAERAAKRAARKADGSDSDGDERQARLEARLERKAAKAEERKKARAEKVQRMHEAKAAKAALKAEAGDDEDAPPEAAAEGVEKAEGEEGKKDGSKLSRSERRLARVAKFKELKAKEEAAPAADKDETEAPAAEAAADSE